MVDAHVRFGAVGRTRKGQTHHAGVVDQHVNGFHGIGELAHTAEIGEIEVPHFDVTDQLRSSFLGLSDGSARNNHTAVAFPTPLLPPVTMIRIGRLGVGHLRSEAKQGDLTPYGCCLHAIVPVARQDPLGERIQAHVRLRIGSPPQSTPAANRNRLVQLHRPPPPDPAIPISKTGCAHRTGSGESAAPHW